MYMYDTHYMYNMNIITINEKKGHELESDLRSVYGRVWRRKSRKERE